MEKLYKVFVSSTSRDLLEHRQRVMNALLRLNCMPVAMELFPADGKDAWTYIQKVIAGCDYYVLILAGKYGTVAEDGLSFTEKEYDFAHSQGIPIYVFAHQNPADLPEKLVELDPVIRQKLQDFRNKASRNHTWREWTSPEQLAGEVAQTIAYATREVEREGWVRGRIAMEPETLKELERLRREVIELRQDRDAQDTSEYMQGEDEFLTQLDWSMELDEGGQHKWKTVGVTITIQNAFRATCAVLFNPASSLTVGSKLRECVDLSKWHIPNSAATRITDPEIIGSQLCIQFAALGLIEPAETSNGLAPNLSYWRLTSMGRQKAIETLAFKRLKPAAGT